MTRQNIGKTHRVNIKVVIHATHTYNENEHRKGTAQNDNKTRYTTNISIIVKTYCETEQTSTTHKTVIQRT